MLKIINTKMIVFGNYYIKKYFAKYYKIDMEIKTPVLKNNPFALLKKVRLTNYIQTHKTTIINARNRNNNILF